jgi:ABC-type Fe3+ transport system permease subunit
MSVVIDRPEAAPQPTAQSSFIGALSGRRATGRRLGLLAVLAVQAVFILPPVVYLIWRSFTTGGEFGQPTVLSLDSYRAVFQSAGTVHMLVDTLTFSIGSSVLAIILGVVLAFLVVLLLNP